MTVEVLGICSATIIKKIAIVSMVVIPIVTFSDRSPELKQACIVDAFIEKHGEKNNKKMLHLVTPYTTGYWIRVLEA